jgi:hypothetical protein
MKKLIIFTVSILIAVTGFSQTKPQPSPESTVQQKVGLTDIKINYYRPGLKGRSMFEKLTPIDKIWRTGANSGTKISFSTNVTIEGEEVPAGEYLIYSIPGSEKWTIMLYTDTSLGGRVANYDEDKELVRFETTSINVDPKVETLTFQIGDLGEESTTASIIFLWENTCWKLRVEVPMTW